MVDIGSDAKREIINVWTYERGKRKWKIAELVPGTFI
jgi:hypothetical protein